MNAGKKNFARRALALLRQGPFRVYIIGSAISDTGTWMQVMAQGWVMSSLTDRGLYLGLAAAAAGIPTILLAMKGGEAADRYDKRKILIWTQVVQIATAAALGFLVWTGMIQIWHIVVLAAVLGICIAYEMPAINALVPELVEKEDIPAAIALDRAVFHGSRLVGPSLAGLFVAWWGAASAFFFNAFSFVALIISMLLLPPRAKGKRGGGRAAQDRVQGRPRLRAQRSHHFVHDRAHCLEHDFRFPIPFHHASPLCPQCSPPRT